MYNVRNGSFKSKRTLSFSGPLLDINEESLEDAKEKIKIIEIESKQTRLKIQKTRQRISSRNGKIAEIMKNLGIDPNSTPAMLKVALDTLQSRKESLAKQLENIRQRDEYFQLKEKESDVLCLFEENERLTKEMEKAREYEEVLRNDISYAIEFRNNAKKMAQELEKIKSDVEKLKSQLSSNKSKSAKFIPKNLLSKEALINEIKHLESTLTAERVSATKSEEIERQGNNVLNRTMDEAIQKIKEIAGTQLREL